MQRTKEAKTTWASKKNKQSEHQRVNEKTSNLKISWKRLPIVKQGYVTKTPRLRMLQRILTRPIKGTKKNNNLKAP